MVLQGTSWVCLPTNYSQQQQQTGQQTSGQVGGEVEGEGVEALRVYWEGLVSEWRWETEEGRLMVSVDMWVYRCHSQAAS